MVLGALFYALLRRFLRRVEVTVKLVELLDVFVDVREEVLACVSDSRAFDIVGQLGMLRGLADK